MLMLLVGFVGQVQTKRQDRLHARSRHADLISVGYERGTARQVVLRTCRDGPRTPTSRARTPSGATPPASPPRRSRGSTTAATARGTTRTPRPDPTLRRHE